MTAKRAVIVVSVMVLLVGLAGCTGPDDPIPTPAPSTPSNEQTADASPTPAQSHADQPAESTADASLDGVACEQLVPLEIISANFYDGAVATTPWGSAADSLPGPAARAAAAAGTEVLTCSWAIPEGSDGGVEVYALTLDSTTEAAFVAQLRSAGSFAERTVDDASIFTGRHDAGPSIRTMGYLFDDAVWIAFYGNSPEESFVTEYAPAMLAAIRPGETG